MTTFEASFCVELGPIWVAGRPRPKGSLKRARGRLVPSSSSTKAWQTQVEIAMRMAHRADPIRGLPIKIVATFSFVRPKSSDRLMPTVVPDLDKLLRTISDAGTGIVYKDDAQIVAIEARKIYGEEDGAWITILVQSGAG